MAEQPLASQFLLSYPGASTRNENTIWASHALNLIYLNTNPYFLNTMELTLLEILGIIALLGVVRLALPKRRA